MKNTVSNIEATIATDGIVAKADQLQSLLNKVKELANLLGMSVTISVAKKT